MNQNAGGEEGPPRSTWWLGPVGVLIGFSIALIVILAITSRPGASAAFLFFILFVIPAVSGYAFRALMRRTARATFSSLGTAVGWMLFLGFLLGDLGLGITMFIGAAFFGPLGIVFLGLVALGFILVSQELASLAVRRVVPS